MPSVSLAAPPGAILPGLAGWNLRMCPLEIEAMRPSGILSGTVVPTVIFGQFQLSSPARPRRILAPPVMLARSEGIFIKRVTRSLEGS
jgi:hypothetical protein